MYTLTQFCSPGSFLFAHPLTQLLSITYLPRTLTGLADPSVSGGITSPAYTTGNHPPSPARLGTLTVHRHHPAGPGTHRRDPSLLPCRISPPPFQRPEPTLEVLVPRLHSLHQGQSSASPAPSLPATSQDPPRGHLKEQLRRRAPCTIRVGDERPGPGGAPREPAPASTL